MKLHNQQATPWSCCRSKAELPAKGPVLLSSRCANRLLKRLKPTPPHRRAMPHSKLHIFSVSSLSGSRKEPQQTKFFTTKGATPKHKGVFIHTYLSKETFVHQSGCMVRFCIIILTTVFHNFFTTARNTPRTLTMITCRADNNSWHHMWIFQLKGQQLLFPKNV